MSWQFSLSNWLQLTIASLLTHELLMAKRFLLMAFGRSFEGLYRGRQCDIMNRLRDSERGQQQTK